MLNEFKKFAMRGNVLDMAVGVIIGGAFGKIVTSFVNDVLMPPLGQLLGGINFNQFFFVLSEQSFSSLEEARKAGAPVFAYGSFLQTVIDFLIIAFSVFLLVKMVNNLKSKPKEEPTKPAEPSAEVKLLTEIRDALLKK